MPTHPSERNGSAGSGPAAPVGLRVLYINEAFRNFGPGPAVHGWALVEEMRSLGIAVDIFPAAPQRSVTELGRPVPGGSSLRSRVRSVLPQELANLVSGVQRTLSRSGAVWFGQRRGRPDVVLGRHIAYDWTPWVAARMLNRPLVLEVNAAMYLEKRLVQVEPPAVLRQIEETQWRNATRIYAVSDELASIVSAAGVPAERIATIPNGAEPLPAIDRTGRGDEPVRIVFVGGFYPWHGIEDLLRAAARIEPAQRRFRLVLIGGGPETQAVRGLVHELGLVDRVEMPGRIAHDEVRRQLRDADIAVAPYPRLDSFYFSPLKLFEYMAAGLPIIASAQGQIAEVLEHGKTGLLYPPGDLAALASLIAQLAQDRPLRHRLGAEAHSALSTRYTWRRTAQRVAELCREAAGGADPAEPHGERPYPLDESSAVGESGGEGRPTFSPQRTIS